MALRFHERESGIQKYPNVDPASWAPCVSGFSDPMTAGSSCSTPTTNGGALRRGVATHGPHGASRRRARSPAERVRAHGPKVDLMINRGRDGMVNAGGAVSEGCSRECQWFVVCRSNTRRRRTLDGHRVSRTNDSEILFAWCARPKLRLRAGPATPHRNRAYGHETSPQGGRCSPVGCLGRRPQAQGAPNTTARPRWSGRTGRWR